MSILARVVGANDDREFPVVRSLRQLQPKGVEVDPSLFEVLPLSLMAPDNYVRCTGWPDSCVKWGSIGPPDSSADSSSDHHQRPTTCSAPANVKAPGSAPGAPLSSEDGTRGHLDARSGACNDSPGERLPRGHRRRTARSHRRHAPLGCVAMAGIQGHGSSNLPLGTIQGGSNGPPAEHPGR